MYVKRTKSFSKTIFHIVLTNGINLIQKLEMQNLYVNLKNHPIGVKLLPQLRQQFTHLNEHKFRLGFNYTVNPMCPSGTDVKITERFLSALPLLFFQEI